MEAICDNRRLVHDSALYVSTISPPERSRRRLSFEGIVGVSPQMLGVFALVRKIADHKTTVLITGETGTGKELIARAIHTNSSRHGNPFVAVNCNAIPDDLMESALFGHVRGSFTNAVRDKKGFFENADTGTLLLDEVGDLPLHLQGTLLRVLQEGEIQKVGSDHAIKVDVRIVAATAKDLAGEVTARRFRDDLYYRLNVLPIELPPLRSRSGDFEVLVDSFLKKHGAELGRRRLKISPSAMCLMAAYPWPGNVRELENVIERLAILTDSDTVGVEQLPVSLHPFASDNLLFELVLRDDGVDFNHEVEVFEDRLIGEAMTRSGGCKEAAATFLGLNRTTLVSKLRRRAEVREAKLLPFSATDDDEEEASSNSDTVPLARA